MDLSSSDRTYVEERAAEFVGRHWAFAEIRGFLAGGPGTFLLLGKPGTGKTAIAARLAMASTGRGGDSGHVPLGEGTISAAVFCRAGKASVAELAQRLSDQLAASVDGFAEALQATAAPGVTIRDTYVEVRGDVHAGGTVSGVLLPQSDGRQAFTAGVAVPLRHLREHGVSAPIVLMVDAVDEAADVDAVNVLSRLLANLGGVHLLVTTRPDPRVLSDFRTASHTLDLVADAPKDDHDVRRYVLDRLAGQGREEVVDVLADRISAEAAGNFLYAFYATGTMVGSGAMVGVDEKSARSLPLPTGGLQGVYEDFLSRQIAGDETKWSGDLRPVLAPLCLALGDGFTTEQLGAIAGRLTSQEFSLTRTRQVTRLSGQFLEGPQPDGPFRVYHQSFSRFLTDPGQNPNWPVDVTETSRAVVSALTPEGQPGSRDWGAASSYARQYLAAHAAAAGVLDDLLADPRYLLAADPIALLPALSSVRTTSERGLADVVRRAAQHLTSTDAASYLEMRARQRNLHAFADAVARVPAERKWQVRWAHWTPGAANQALGGDSDEIVALSATQRRTGSPLALVGRRSGAVEAWDLALNEQVARWHPEGLDMALIVVLADLPDGPALVVAWMGGVLGVFDVLNESGHLARQGGVTAMCATVSAGQPVCITAHSDGRLVMWTLPELAVIHEVRDATSANTYGLAVVSANGQRVLLSVNDSLRRRKGEGRDASTLRMWSLHGLSLLWEDHLGRRDVPKRIESYKFRGREIAAISQNGWGPFQLWDLDQRTILLEGDEACTHAWAYEHDGQLFVIEAKSGALILRPILDWSNETPPRWALGTGVRSIETEGDNFTSLVDLNGQTTLLSSKGGYVKIWNVQAIVSEALDGAPPAEVLGAQRLSFVNVLAWAGHRPWELYAAVGDSVIALDVTDGTILWEQHLRHHPGHDAFIKALAFTPSHNRLVASCNAGCLHVLDPEARGGETHTLELGVTLERMCITELIGKQLCFVTGDRGGAWQVLVWDLDKGEEFQTYSAYQLSAGEEDKVMRGLAAAPYATGVRFAFASKYGKVMVADLSGTNRGLPFRAFEEWRIPNNDGEAVTCLAASKDSLLLAAATEHGTMAIWDFEGGTLLAHRSRAHLHGANAMQFGSWAGRPTLVAGGDDGILRVWSTDLDELLNVETDGPIHSLTLLGGNQIAVAGKRGVLMVEFGLS